jgi:hypothetical protein
MATRITIAHNQSLTGSKHPTGHSISTRVQRFDPPLFWCLRLRSKTFALTVKGLLIVVSLDCNFHDRGYLLCALEDLNFISYSAERQKAGLPHYAETIESEITTGTEF